jgi:hypothetical protein
MLTMLLCVAGVVVGLYLTVGLVLFCWYLVECWSCSDGKEVASNFFLIVFLWGWLFLLAIKVGFDLMLGKDDYGEFPECQRL